MSTRSMLVPVPVNEPHMSLVPDIAKINMYIDGLVKERRNSIANTLELRLSCNTLSIRYITNKMEHCHQVTMYLCFPKKNFSS